MADSKKQTVGSSQLAREILEIVRHARAGAYRAVNTAMVEAYWQIGRRIVREEQHGRARAGYGQELVRTVARRLTAEFGRGFSEANVWNFRQFYLTYPSEKILYALRRELSWSHHRHLETVGRWRKRWGKNLQTSRMVPLKPEGPERWRVRRR